MKSLECGNGQKVCVFRTIRHDKLGMGLRSFRKIAYRKWRSKLVEFLSSLIGQHHQVAMMERKVASPFTMSESVSFNLHIHIRAHTMFGYSAITIVYAS